MALLAVRRERIGKLTGEEKRERRGELKGRRELHKESLIWSVQSAGKGKGQEKTLSDRNVFQQTAINSIMKIKVIMEHFLPNKSGYLINMLHN